MLLTAANRIVDDRDLKLKFQITLASNILIFINSLHLYANIYGVLNTFNMNKANFDHFPPR